MKRAASADEHGRRGRQMRAQALQQIVGVAVATGGSTRDQLHGSEAAFGWLEACAWGELSAPDIKKKQCRCTTICEGYCGASVRARTIVLTLSKRWRDWAQVVDM